MNLTPRVVRIGATALASAVGFVLSGFYLSVVLGLAAFIATWLLQNPQA